MLLFAEYFLKGRYDSFKRHNQLCWSPTWEQFSHRNKPGEYTCTLIVGVEGWGLASQNHGAAGNSWPKADIAVGGQINSLLKIRVYLKNLRLIQMYAIALPKVY